MRPKPPKRSTKSVHSSRIFSAAVHGHPNGQVSAMHMMYRSCKVCKISTFCAFCLFVLAVTCLPISVSNTVNSTDTSVGAILRVSCPSGTTVKYTSSDEITAVCLPTGKWSQDIPKCDGKLTQDDYKNISVTYVTEC